jgi:hypothetical protein
MSKSIKTKAELTEAYIACLLGEINQYQTLVRAYQTCTQAAMPQTSLKAAIGETNNAKDAYYAAVAAEREQKRENETAGAKGK